MTHQYKRRQQTLINEMNRLKQLIAEKEDEIEVRKEEFKQMSYEMQKLVDEKEEDNKILQQKIGQMSSDFSNMLSETLKKMDKKIDMAQWDNDDNTAMVEKIGEMNVAKE